MIILRTIIYLASLSSPQAPMTVFHCECVFACVCVCLPGSLPVLSTSAHDCIPLYRSQSLAHLLSYPQLSLSPANRRIISVPSLTHQQERHRCLYYASRLVITNGHTSVRMNYFGLNSIPYILRRIAPTIRNIVCFTRPGDQER